MPFWLPFAVGTVSPFVVGYLLLRSGLSVLGLSLDDSEGADEPGWESEAFRQVEATSADAQEQAQPPRPAVEGAEMPEMIGRDDAMRPQTRQEIVADACDALFPRELRLSGAKPEAEGPSTAAGPEERSAPLSRSSEHPATRPMVVDSYSLHSLLQKAGENGGPSPVTPGRVEPGRRGRESDGVSSRSDASTHLAAPLSWLPFALGAVANSLLRPDLEAELQGRINSLLRTMGAETMATDSSVSEASRPSLGTPADSTLSVSALAPESTPRSAGGRQIVTLSSAPEISSLKIGFLAPQVRDLRVVHCEPGEAGKHVSIYTVVTDLHLNCAVSFSVDAAASLDLRLIQIDAPVSAAVRVTGADASLVLRVEEEALAATPIDLQPGRDVSANLFRHRLLSAVVTSATPDFSMKTVIRGHSTSKLILERAGAVSRLLEKILRKAVRKSLKGRDLWALLTQ